LDSLLTETGAATVSKPEREKTATDSTIKKVEAGWSPRGDMGQKYLVAGKKVSMRLWTHEPGGKLRSPTKRDYETIGYVISGKAELHLEGQLLQLKAGDSWLVSSGSITPLRNPGSVHRHRGHCATG
jgi:quercetin dioxygenase-like cupin family protein